MIHVKYRMMQYIRLGEESYVLLLKVYYLFGIIRIWSTQIDKAEMPTWAYISKACLGYSEWKNPLWEKYKHLKIN